MVLRLLGMISQSSHYIDLGCGRGSLLIAYFSTLSQPSVNEFECFDNGCARSAIGKLVFGPRVQGLTIAHHMFRVMKRDEAERQPKRHKGGYGQRSSCDRIRERRR